MKLFICILTALILFAAPAVKAAQDFEFDKFPSEKGEIKIVFVGHGSLILEHDHKIIHIDPCTQFADYSLMPKADLILITHEHADHLDEKAIASLKKESTQIICNEACLEKVPGSKVLKNDESAFVLGINISALPAYNLVHKRNEKEVFHPKGRGNAYLLAIGGKRILIGGDTENIEELKVLKNIDVAFLPMNIPYTMTPEMVADLALAIKPAILYPYHYGETDTSRLVELLKSNPEIEVRIRKLQ